MKGNCGSAKSSWIGGSLLIWSAIQSSMSIESK